MTQKFMVNNLMELVPSSLRKSNIIFVANTESDGQSEYYYTYLVKEDGQPFYTFEGCSLYEHKGRLEQSHKSITTHCIVVDDKLVEIEIRGTNPFSESIESIGLYKQTKAIMQEFLLGKPFCTCILSDQFDEQRSILTGMDLSSDLACIRIETYTCNPEKRVLKCNESYFLINRAGMTCRVVFADGNTFNNRLMQFDSEIDNTFNTLREALRMNEFRLRNDSEQLQVIKDFFEKTSNIDKLIEPLYGWNGLTFYSEVGQYSSYHIEIVGYAADGKRLLSTDTAYMENARKAQAILQYLRNDCLGINPFTGEPGQEDKDVDILRLQKGIHVAKSGMYSVWYLLLDNIYVLQDLRTYPHDKILISKLNLEYNLALQLQE